MEELKTIVHELLRTKGNLVPLLQQINDAMLRHYQLVVNDALVIRPKEVEIYYVNKSMPNPYVDMNMHCVLDPKTNGEIWALQSGRFGQLYIHQKGPGGVDVCLSESSDYALCCTIKAASVNGEDVWSGIKVRDRVLESEMWHQQQSDKAVVISAINSSHSPVVLAELSEPEDDVEIYYLQRSGLRHKDKFSHYLLCSVVDIWNEKLSLTRVQKVNLYMSRHPEADVLQVLRQHDFKYIPLEVKVRYHLDRKAKLYE